MRLELRSGSLTSACLADACHVLRPGSCASFQALVCLLVRRVPPQRPGRKPAAFVRAVSSQRPHSASPPPPVSASAFPCSGTRSSEVVAPGSEAHRSGHASALKEQFEAERPQNGGPQPGPFRLPTITCLSMCCLAPRLQPTLAPSHGHRGHSRNNMHIDSAGHLGGRCRRGHRRDLGLALAHVCFGSLPLRLLMCLELLHLCPGLQTNRHSRLCHLLLARARTAGATTAE